MKKKEIAGIAVRCAVAVTLFVLAIVFYDDLGRLKAEDINAWLSTFSENIPLLCCVVLAVYAVKAALFVIPASAVYVAVGAVFSAATPIFTIGGAHGAAVNLTFAVILNLLGILLEVTVTYFIGRFLGKDAVYKLLSKKPTGQKILAKDIQDKAGVLIAVRAVPAFPIDFISLFYGASGCRYPKYAILSVAGISWRVILFTVIGDSFFRKILELIPMKYIVTAVIIAIPVVLAVWLIKKFRKKKTETESQNPVPED